MAADRLKEEMAHERAMTARASRLPELNVGLKGGFLGQPIVWQNGMSNPTYPESPDWQQNYAIDFHSLFTKEEKFAMLSVRQIWNRK